MNAFHVSNTRLYPGEIIKSFQSKCQTYEFYWRIYSEVCLTIFNRKLPRDYGYAYPIGEEYRQPSEFPSRRHYIVEASDNKVIKGNFNYSIYVMMEVDQIPRV